MTMFKMCAIRDTVADAWMMPQFWQSTGQAVRALKDVLQDKSQGIGAHPEDYVMYLVGEYDDATGDIFAVGPEKIINAHALVVDDEPAIGLS